MEYEHKKSVAQQVMLQALYKTLSKGYSELESIPVKAIKNCKLDQDDLDEANYLLAQQEENVLPSIALQSVEMEGFVSDVNQQNQPDLTESGKSQDLDAPSVNVAV
jgi:hypothetical protein